MPNTPTGFHDATFWVQVEPQWASYTNGDGMRPLAGVKAVALTLKRPDKQRSGTVLTKLTLRIPDGAFMPLRPEAIIVIPESMAVPAPIEVEAGDPES